MLTEGADPVRKVSIIPRGLALGVTFAAPESDRFNYREPEVHAKINVALGGRAAEEVVFGETSTGAESDIQQLTQIARQMVGRWGMSSAIGPVAVLPRDGSGPFLPGAAEVSPHTQQLVDDEVRRIVDEAHKQVLALLRAEPEQARLACDRAARARDAGRGRRLRGRRRAAGRRRGLRVVRRGSSLAGRPSELAGFFFDRALGGRNHFEALVRDRLSALDREAVGAGCEPRLRPFDGRELLAEIVCEALVELVLVQLGRQVARVLVVCLLAGVLMPARHQQPLDPRPLGGQELACAIGIHSRNVIESSD